MGRPNKKRRSGCPVAYGLDTFGDSWSLLVIRDLMLNGKKTYGDFLEADEGIATNILAHRLKHMEAEGLIEKFIDPENRRSYIYTLTEKGRDLAPVILEIIRWSGKYTSLTSARRKLVERVKRDRDGFVAEINSRLSDG